MRPDTRLPIWRRALMAGGLSLLACSGGGGDVLSSSSGGATASGGASSGGASSGGAPSGGGTSSGGATSTGGSGGSGCSDVPPTPACYCAPTANWDSETISFDPGTSQAGTHKWVDYEAEVVKLVNEVRKKGGVDCGSEGSFGPTTPLTVDPAFTCAARIHALDVAWDRNTSGHSGPDRNGDGKDDWPSDRMKLAGAVFTQVGENMAYGTGHAGYPGGAASPQAVVDGWLGSDGHCANMMDPKWKRIGVGFALKIDDGTDPRPGGAGQHFRGWVQVFAP